MSDEIRDTAFDFDYGYDDSAPPVWETIIELGASLPPEVWERVPTDLASNLDHYLYGRTLEAK